MASSSFADRLRQAMAEKGLKQADLIHAAASHGERLGKSQVSQYVSGKVVPARERGAPARRAARRGRGVARHRGGRASCRAA